MSNTQKKPRFGLAANKAATDDKVGELLHAVESHVSMPSKARKETGPQSKALPQSSSAADDLLTAAPTRFIETTPRIREQLPIGATFSQKCAVGHIERFNLLCKERSLVKRDMLEEGLDYLFQKYDAPDIS